MGLEKVTAGVWRGGTRYVNWYLVDAGEQGVTLVDAGLPSYDRTLDADLASIGKQRTDVRAVVLTHGHVDHVGMAGALAAAGATVHLHPADEKLADDPRSNETDSSLLPYLRWPATLAFVVHAARQGALRPHRMPPSARLADGAVVDVPGSPTVTHTPGHTAGSCVLEFREHGVVFVGDLLCTADPRTGRTVSPQLQTRGSNRDSDQAMSSLARLDGIASPLVLPGHGAPWDDGVVAAVESARLTGCR